MKDLNVIMAIDQNYGLGYKNKLPWNVPADLKLFKRYTENSVLIVGKNTFSTLPKLPSRTILVLTTNIYSEYDYNSACHSTHPSFESALSKARSLDQKIFVIGGKTLYEYVLTRYKHEIDTFSVSFIEGKHVCDTYLDRSVLNGFETTQEHVQDGFTHRLLSLNEKGEDQYLHILRNILAIGELRETRNGAVLSSFDNYSLKFDLRRGFPLLTTKKMFLRGVVEELLFFLRGDTDTKKLEAMNINIWKGNTSREFLDNNGFADWSEGEMGLLYGFQWRHYNSFCIKDTMKSVDILSTNGVEYIAPLFNVDQIQFVINEIRTNPTSRRILLTSYNPSQVKNGVLYPCHSVIIQFYVSAGYLDMFCYNRSSDVFLGLPFNIASSALLLVIIAKICNLEARHFHLTLGDAHIYEQHKESTIEQIERIPYRFPSIEITRSIKSIDDIETLSHTDFIIKNYQAHPCIKNIMIA